MPITSITLENFKGISDPVTIPIRPITLLFGKNSAGKSTIIQALHYLREVLENRQPDPDRTQLGGDVIDLGGFQSLVHKNELDRQIRIRVDFSNDSDDEDSLPFYGIKLENEYEENQPSVKTDLSSGIARTTLFEEKFEEIKALFKNNLDKNRSDLLDINGAYIGKFITGVEVVIEYNQSDGAHIAEYAVYFSSTDPYVSATSAGMVESAMIRLRQRPNYKPEIVEFCFSHDLSAWLDEQLNNPDPEDNASYTYRMRDLFAESFNTEAPFKTDDLVTPVPLDNQSSVIPDAKTPFSFKPITNAEDDLLYHRDSYGLRSVIAQALVGPLSALVKELQGMRYLGPIRQVPHRGYNAVKTSIESRWANGLAAWDALVRSASDEQSTLVKDTSRYLEDDLKLGYSVRVEHLISIDAEGDVMNALRFINSQVEYDELDSSFFRRAVMDPLEGLPRKTSVILRDEVKDIDVEFADVGVGVSQVLPVVVGSILPFSVFAVEQPELHLHPAAQLALGDLFIKTATSDKNKTLLIETHSEHLLLRMLSRIEEGEEELLTSIPQAERKLLQDIQEIGPEMLSVIYVKPSKDGTQFTVLPVTEDGDFEFGWPDGFFEEREKELLG